MTVTPESSVVYDDDISISKLTKDEDENINDDIDDAMGDHNNVGEDDEEDDENDDGDEEEDDDEETDLTSEQDHNLVEISRSVTATPLNSAFSIKDESDLLHKSKKTKTLTKDSSKLDDKSKSSQAGKKVPLHLLEKRRLGRIKAAEEFSKKLKQIGIEKIDSTTLPATGLFQPILLINQKNYSSDYLKKDEQTFALRERKFLRNITNNTNNNTPDVILDNNNSTIIDNKSIKYNNEDIDLNDPSTAIIIQPGYDSIKIGFALDESPLKIPNSVAIPISDKKNAFNSNSNLTAEQSEEFMNLKSQLYQSFKERMRYYKRRIQPNSHEQVNSFNSQTKPELISQQNDPSRIPWILPNDTTDTHKYLYGDEALLAPEPYFKHRKPFTSSGMLNIDSEYYSSVQELLGDVTKLLEYALAKVLERHKNQLKETTNQEKASNNESDKNNSTLESEKPLNDLDLESSRFKVILVIPDLFQKSHLETMIRLLLTELPFQALAIIQESLANCYGAGLGTSTCVVNIGANETNVACVDEGSVVENSIVKLNYGGDDVTKLFSVLLKQSQFPYSELDINTTPGWRLAESLKKDLVTFQDDGVAVQLPSFIKRIPNEPVEKYEFKIFDEVMLAPLALFYPKIFGYLKKNLKKNEKLEQLLKLQLPESRDLFTNNLNDWRSITQEESIHDSNLQFDQTPDTYSDVHDDYILLRKLLDVNDKVERTSTIQSNCSNLLNMIPLDKAIIQSITNASLTVDPFKMSTYYSNILVVGGSSKIEAFDFMLTDRINIWRPRLLSLGTFPNFYEDLVKKIKEKEKQYNSEKSKSSINVNTNTSSNLNENVDDDEEEDNDEDDEDDGNEKDTAIDSSKEPINGNGSSQNTTTKEDNSESEKLKFEAEIADMIKENLQKFLLDSEKTANNNDHYSPVTVIAPPKEMDPASLGWKGASVLAQIKLIEELYITYSDWDMHGNRILQYKCIFTY